MLTGVTDSLTSYTGEEETEVARTRERVRQQAIDTLIGIGNGYIHRGPQMPSSNFYGRFAGLNVLRAVGDMTARYSKAPLPAPGRELVEAFERPALPPSANVQGGLFALLPLRKRAQDLVERALTRDLVGHDSVDRERFPRQLDRLYERDPDDYETCDHTFLAQVYALLALGRRTSPPDEYATIDDTKETMTLKGYVPRVNETYLASLYQQPLYIHFH